MDHNEARVEKYQEQIKSLKSENQKLRDERDALEAERTIYQECCAEEETEREKLQVEFDSLKLFAADMIRAVKQLRENHEVALSILNLKEISMDMTAEAKRYYEKHYGQLLGFTVEGIGLDDSDDCMEPTFCLILKKGDKAFHAFISCDEEGNGPGFLHIEPAQ